MNVFLPIRKMMWLGMCVMLLSGCWDRVEVNDLALVVGTVVDKKENGNVELAVELIIPQAAGGGSDMMGGGGDGGGAKTYVVAAEGADVADAIRKLQEKLPRKIFWAHNMSVIFGERLLREGIGGQLDFFDRYYATRKQYYVFAAKSPASALLQATPPVGRSSGEVMLNLTKTEVGVEMTVKDVLQMLNSDAHAVILPWIEQNPAVPGEEEKQDTSLRVSGVAVLKKDKIVGRIDDTITRGVMWVRNKVKTAIVTVKPKGTKGKVSVELLEADTKLVPSVTGGKWKMTVRIKTEGNVIQNTTDQEIDNPNVTKKLEKDIERDIQRVIMASLDQVQKGMKADVFGFAEAFHRQYPDRWHKVKDRWDEVFPNVEVKVAPRVSILRPGMTNESPVTEVKQP
ncbi:Ger(x)C family spore germination protein [Polycladomyces subterraneus]|uniref:Ger(X)C family spore germination protein n=1 Tax=Polycladomyces subterraneus TaxID=1016997 RepID=A0ABT8IPE6_9BACL|nr:Ger(x)C family spore germination protein [Polycladomyces subterraneus]MDN4594660.1 Ger(x)C family spore germination protein [Polycladomyces subterraneus]